LFLLNENANPPLVDGQPLPRCRERVELLIADLKARGESVLLPTPVLTEVLIRAEAAAAGYLQILSKETAIRIVDFDRLAAVETARMLGQLLSTGQWPKGSEPRTKLKFDAMIAGIAKTRQASMVYSDDGNMRALGRTFGFSVKGLVDLPLPAQG